MSGFGSNACADCVFAGSPVAPNERRAGAAESDSASTRSLTMKSLLLKVSKLNICGARVVCKVPCLVRPGTEECCETREAASGGVGAMLEVRRLSQLHTAIVYLPSSANESTNQQLLQVYLRAATRSQSVDGITAACLSRPSAGSRLQGSQQTSRQLLGEK
jgi:hypothetical protein